MENTIKRMVKQYEKVKKIIKDIYEKDGKSLYWVDAENDFNNHILDLFLAIATCHYPVSNEEICFIECFFNRTDIRSLIESEDAISTKKRIDNLIMKVPSYLNDISNMDKNKVKTVISMILEIGVELAAIDMDYSAEEAKLITAIGDSLNASCISNIPSYKNVLEKYRDIARSSKGNEVMTNNNDPEESLEDILKELDELIGLNDIKFEINTLINLTKINNIRKIRGLKTVTMSRHMVFMGSPGTGKTTIARIVSRIYKALGVLSKGHLVETDRAGLVAGYVGQTASNVKKVVESAIGGILFIDEAYSLTYSDSAADFGQEAVDTIVKLMEDNRDDLIVIVAGYEQEMKDFINSNPGLKSRFNKYITFNDYTSEELFEIFMMLVNKNMFIIDEEATIYMKKLLEEKAIEEGFGNGRGVRNCFEKLLEIQANRIVSVENISDRDLQTITKDDVISLYSEC